MFNGEVVVSGVQNSKTVQTRQTYFDGNLSKFASTLILNPTTSPEHSRLQLPLSIMFACMGMAMRAVKVALGER
jgi:hypothetical protein